MKAADLHELARGIFCNVGYVAEKLEDVDGGAVLDDEDHHQMRISLLAIVSKAADLDMMADELAVTLAEKAAARAHDGPHNDQKAAE